MTIGICGGSGAGKTTLLKRLYAEYSQFNPSVLSLDNYYLPIEKQVKDENGQYNFDLPSALDREKIYKDLLQLKSGKSIRIREYHFNAPPNTENYIEIHPSDMLIVEGIFLFEYQEVAKEMDFNIFIELDFETQLQRRIIRDKKTRGYSEEAIIYQWENHVMPCYEKHLLPYKSNADFVYRNDERADEDFEKLIKILNTAFIKRSD